MPSSSTNLTRLGLIALALLAAVGTAPAYAQDATNVLLVVNSDSAVSVDIGDYYAAKRGVPVTNIVRLKTPIGDGISRADYEQTIEGPIGRWLLQHDLEDQILDIVLTKGIALRINGTGGREGTIASVDSELTLLYRKLLGFQTLTVGFIDNPLFVGDRDIATIKPVTRNTSDIYLVTRLDGFTVEDMKGLVDRGIAPTTNGLILLDQKATAIDRGGDRWLQTAADRLKTAATKVVLDKTTAVAKSDASVLGYYSWGSNDPSNQLRRFGLTFAPGAIGGMFVSTDGRTFEEPPDTWKPSNPDGGPVFRGSFQSLAGDLIRDGITGVSAHVDEPYLDATVRPQVLFPAYVSGFTLAESFYFAMPYLSWRNIVVGDPLCRPFDRKPLTSPEIAKPIDPDTELPGLFSDRRLALLSDGGLNQAAIKLLLKKDSQITHGNASNAEALLVKATDLEPRLVDAHMQLAALYESRKDYVRAIDRYRRVLAVASEHPMALNNIAYDLAVYQNNPKEALPYAERGYRLSKQAPAAADTLGWIYHELGDDSTATFYLEQALRGLPNHPDVLIHAATVHAALNDRPRARAELAAAGKLGAAVTSRDDFKTLRDQLSH